MRHSSSMRTIALNDVCSPTMTTPVVMTSSTLRRMARLPRDGLFGTMPAAASQAQGRRSLLGTADRPSLWPERPDSGRFAIEAHQGDRAITPAGGSAPGDRGEAGAVVDLPPEPGLDADHAVER